MGKTALGGDVSTGWQSPHPRALELSPLAGVVPRESLLGLKYLYNDILMVYNSSMTDWVGASVLPTSVLAAAMKGAMQHDRALARRMTLIALLWEESGIDGAGLLARVESRLGKGCFGRQPELAFRRDMQVVKTILAQAGLPLKYSRRSKQAGYFVEGRPVLPPEVATAIAGAADEIDPHQIQQLARLTTKARLNLANTLSAEVLALAVRAEQRLHP